MSFDSTEGWDGSQCAGEIMIVGHVLGSGTETVEEILCSALGLSELILDHAKLGLEHDVSISQVVDFVGHTGGDSMRC